MELTKNNTSLTGSFSDILKSGILPLGIIALVAMMVLPLPVFFARRFFYFKHIDLFSHPDGGHAYL